MLAWCVQGPEFDLQSNKRHTNKQTKKHLGYLKPSCGLWGLAGEIHGDSTNLWASVCLIVFCLFEVVP